MPRAVRCCILSLLVGGVFAAAVLLQRERPRAVESSAVLAAQGGLKWYRGNIHTHSLWSDGDDYLEMIALWYRDRDYQFLCFTDHNVLPETERWVDARKNKGGLQAYEKLMDRFPEGWVEERTVKDDAGEERLEVRLKTFAEVAGKLDVAGSFLLIQGEEISGYFKKRPVHMNATNLREVIPPQDGKTLYEMIQANTDAVLAQRQRTGQPILVHLNHPNFGYGITAEDLMRVRGENFFEVYNGHPSVSNHGDSQHASTERIWDIILTRRIAELNMPLMYGLATDDGHEYHFIPSRRSEPGRGWVMVLTDKLTTGSLIAALERGEFYASSGVTLDKIRSDANGLSFDIVPQPDVQYTVEFIGTRVGFDPQSEPVLDDNGEELETTHRYSADIGVVLKSVEGTKVSYQFAGDELYVRARVQSNKRHPNPGSVGEMESAWVQPVKGPAAPKQ